MRRVTVGVLVAGLCLASTATAQERYTLRGAEVAIYNLAGEVRVEGGTGREVAVEVRRGGRDAGRLRVESGPAGGRETLRVVYPEGDVVYSGRGRWLTTSVRVNPDGTFGGRRGAGRQVRIQGSGRGTEAYADLMIRVPAGGAVRVYNAVGEVTVRNVDGDLLLDTHSAAVTTERTRGRLNIDVGSGSVSVTGAEGEVDIDTGSGSVRVAGIRATTLRIDTGSGGVSGGDIEVNRLDVDTGSGRVRLQGVGMRDGRVDTGSGGVELELTRAVRALEVDTGSGGVRLSLPRETTGELHISTGSGGIHVDVPVEAAERSRSRFRARLGDGEGSIRVKTGSGGVRVQRA